MPDYVGTENENVRYGTFHNSSNWHDKAEFEAGCDFYHDEDGKLACDRKNSEKKTE